LRAAINSDVDILLTGDKDFLEADIDKPKTMTAAEFLDL
jgi:predicted nucleic acid-binding protein